jgi:DNA-binding NtrC family response regulator
MMAGKCVLLVDDEAVLVALLQKYLERQGLTTKACTDPAEALRLVESEPQRFWLVVSDMTLPGMSGAELIEQIRALHPGIHAIIASGYPYQPPTADVAFLQKPFLPKMLLDMIQKLPGSRSAMQSNSATGNTAQSS